MSENDVMVGMLAIIAMLLLDIGVVLRDIKKYLDTVLALLRESRDIKDYLGAVLSTLSEIRDRRR